MSISGDMKPQKFLILISLSSWPHTCIPVSGLASGPRSTEAIVDRTEAWAAETHTAPGTAATPELDIAGVEGGAGDGGARRMGLAKWQWVMWCKGGACRGLLLQGLDLTAGLGGASVPMAAPHAPARQPPNNLLLFILLLPPEIIAIINFPDISPVCLSCR